MAHPPLGLRWQGLAALRHGLALLARRIEGHLADERGRLGLWLPVGFGLGIGLYFTLPSEPWPGFWLLVAGIGLGLFWFARRDATASLLPALLISGAAAAALGMSAAQLRNNLVEAPVLERRGAYHVAGEVALVDERIRGQRLLIEAPRIDELEQEATPARVRFTVRSGGVEPGDRIRVRVVLMPPSPPAAPGDFDFARRAWFERLGAVGYAIGPLERRGRASTTPWLASARHHVAARIRDVTQGSAGAVGVALMTGLRGAIPGAVWDDMQAAGVAHLLAISGLHLGLVAGTIFFSVRIGIALLPPLALRVNGKKVAASVALVAAFAYLLLTGATVPTRRAFIMTALALVAILFDRDPFSMRLVAFAALVVLVLQPESLLGPSFQMSFAAVVALIAAYETGIGHRPDRFAGLDRRVLLYFLGVGLTTLIASLATAPFAAFHFHRFASYGVVANLAAVPLTAFWIMPLGLLGLLLLPFGLDGLPFAAMGQGIDLLLGVAAAVADLPGAALRVRDVPAEALIVLTLGGLWLCIWRWRWRRHGLLALPVAILLAWLARPPDLLMDRSGRLVAVRLADGEVALAPYERDRWVTSQWLERHARKTPVPWPGPGEAIGEELRCDPLGCVFMSRDLAIALPRLADALEDDCARADLVIAYPRLERCPNGRPLIGPKALRNGGGLALWVEDDGFRVVTTQEARGDRPWVR